MNDDITKEATDLTQLSSREQLSALMDGALPADETRFLLRRLQHDASLAECWERWRLSAEVMRGLAPAQRLPADFASRVAASLHGETAPEETSNRPNRAPAWLRWSGGAAVAASLAVAAVMTRPVAVPTPDAAAVAVADGSSTAADPAPSPRQPTQDQGSAGSAIESQAAALATAVAAAARPVRNNRRNTQDQERTGRQAPSSTPAVMRMQQPDAAVAANDGANDGVVALMPPDGIVTRPWPRSVLPQFGNNSNSVGFGESARGAAPYNPFQASGLGGLPPALIVGQDADTATPEAGETAADPPSQSTPSQR